jgi:predicted nucleic acid-binding protein
MSQASSGRPASGAALLRVVLDTGVYAAAFGFPKGRNARIWAAARAGRYRLLTTAAGIQELAGILRSAFQWQDDQLEKRIRILAQVAEMVSSDGAPATPGKNHVLECAVTGQADLIVSNDPQLLDMKFCNNIAIIDGPDFRRILR